VEGVQQVGFKESRCVSRNRLAGLCGGPKQEGVQKEKGWYLAKQRVPMEGNLSEGHQGQAEETKMKQWAGHQSPSHQVSLDLVYHVLLLGLKT